MSASEPVITSKNVDLTNCDREQIQYAGAIQPHGAMLVLLEPELCILQASTNVTELLGLPSESIVQRTLAEVLTEEPLRALQGRLRREKLDVGPMHVGRVRLNGRDFDLLAHRHDQVLILEFELRPASAAVRSELEMYPSLRAAIAQLQATNSLQAFLDLAVQKVRAFTGFDRVMAYKFLEDGSGCVRSEAVAEGMQSYLGLHYPPSDIPAPARRLFSLTWLRHQPDIAYTPIPIWPENNPVTNAPLDMSYAFLRSVSIMYVDYLKNMGTQSSMVMTLLKDGRLWGLIACHHHTGPKHVPYEVRVACEFLAHMASLLMSAKEDLENYDYKMKLQTTRSMLIERVERNLDFVTAFVQDSPNLLDFVDAEGAAVVVKGKIAVLGSTPAEADVEQIVTWLSSEMSEEILAIDSLAARLLAAGAFKDRCAGLLALRLSQTRRDFLIWFRPETEQTVDWAGDPRKPVDLSDDGQRLMPRTSFALWKETVRLKCVPWQKVEIEAARELRAALLEVLLRRAEELDRVYQEMERRHAELDSFAYVVSHDLKEPLRAIKNHAELLREDYANRLDDEGNQSLETLRRLSQRMDELIDSLLEYSRLGRSEFASTEVDLGAAVQEALELLEDRLRVETVEVRVIGLMPVVRGDRTRLVDVFTNLISNAIKYNDKIEKQVEIGCENASAREPVIYVRDNGIGIQPQHHEQIFQIFRRLHARDEFGGGAGAGLTIARKIIDRHGGRIWVESESGIGTTFRFTINQSQAGAHA